MTTYVIGDVQGCYDELRALLAKIDFKSDSDQLWFTGDLVNRGPKSLEVLRFVKSLQDNAITVLGNHDLHFLAIAMGHYEAHRKDTLESVLSASDRQQLTDWLISLPLLHHDERLDFTMIHAGLPPQWTLTQASQCAKEVEQVLRIDNRRDDFFSNMYGDQPDKWSADLTGIDRLRFITNCFTRLRFCSKSGRIDMKQKGPIGSQGEKLIPWFQAPARATAQHRIVFGHWSALGINKSDNAYAIDTGCIWGNSLTALQLEPTLHWHQVTCA